MISASQVHAASQCSYRFRDDVPKERRPSGEAAKLGTAAHELLEDACEAWGERVMTDCIVHPGSERHAQRAYEWVLKFGKPNHVEVGFLYNAEKDTCAIGPRRGEKGYDTAPPFHVRGTFDLVWIRGDEGVVVDYKTGKEQNAHIEQLHCQAVAASRIWGLKSVQIGFLFSRLTKVIAPQFTELSADDLDAEAGRLYRLARKLPTAEATPGDYCKWCDVVPGNCPAWLDATG